MCRIEADPQSISVSRLRQTIWTSDLDPLFWSGVIANFFWIVLFGTALRLFFGSLDVGFFLTADIPGLADFLLTTIRLHEFARGLSIIAIGGFVTFTFVSRRRTHENSPLVSDSITTRGAGAGSGYAWRMYWILAAICLLLALAVPKLRRVGIIGFIILAVLLAWAMVQRLQDSESVPVQERGRPTTPIVASQPFPIESLDLEARLSGGGAPFKLAGTIINRSTNMSLRSVALEIIRRDCYAGALDPSGCVVIWRNRHWLQVNVPPQQQREFGVSLWARGDAPQAKGTTRDEFEIVAANGAAAHED